MISTTRRLSRDDLWRLTGWELKPEGLCRDDVCLPFASDDPRSVDLEQVAGRLGAPLLRDEAHGLWALGPEATGAKFLADARFPDLTLPDLDGRPFAFSSLLGRKIVMVAWASW